MAENITTFRMYLASCTGNAQNTMYRNPVEISTAEDLAAACRKDHVCTEFVDNRRGSDNFIRCHAIQADCDNDNTEDPAAWITPETVAARLPGIAFYAVKSRNCDKVKHPGEPGEKSARPRYHYYFPLRVAVPKIHIIRAIMARILVLFPEFDRDGMKPAQFFYGHAEPVAEYHPGENDIAEYFIAHPEKPADDEPADDEPAEKPERIRNATNQDDFFSQNVEDMLTYISADDYGTWVTVGNALMNAGQPFDIWDRWSRSSGKYPGETAAARKWQSFHDEGADRTVTAGTIVDMAKQNGWKPDPEKLTGEYKASHEAAEVKRKEREKYRAANRENHAAALAAIGIDCGGDPYRYTWKYDWDGSMNEVTDRDTGEIVYKKPKEESTTLPAWIFQVETKAGTVKHINEPVFCDYFKSAHHLARVNSVFYYDGRAVTDDFILNEIQKLIQLYFVERVGRLTANIFLTLSNACYTVQPSPSERKVYCGDYVTLLIDDNGEISQEKEDVFTLTRIPVIYDPEASCPTFEKYLHDVFFDEDIAAIQEFVGYCLIPTTRAQTALFIHGKGGEGKSVFRDVLMKLFGHTAKQEAISNLDKAFVMANLENILVCIDDDMQTALMGETATLKRIITMKGPQQVERKHLQKHDALIYARLIGIGNSFIGSKFDQSDGFYRRQLLVDCKPKTRDTDDRFMSDKCVAEIQGILNWALEGLSRLIKSNYNFTVSKRMKETLESIRRENDNVLYFLENNVEETENPDDFISSADLFAAYALDCKDNGDMPVKKKTFQSRISEKYRDRKDRRIQHIAASEHSSLPSVDRKVAGYAGLRFIDHVEGYKWMSRLHRNLNYDDETYINRLS